MPFTCHSKKNIVQKLFIQKRKRNVIVIRCRIGCGVLEKRTDEQLRKEIEELVRYLSRNSSGERAPKQAAASGSKH